MRISIKTAAPMAAALCLFATAAASQELVYSGAATTSDDYQLGVLWSNVLSRELPDIRMTVVEAGTVAGFRRAAQGQIDIVGIGAPHFLDAVNRAGRYAEDPEELAEGYKDMKVLFAISTGMAQYVAPADSDISEFRDFAGHTVGIGQPGGNAGRVTQTLFGIHGIDGQVDGQHIEYGPALSQMAAGTMDATLVWGGIPDPAIDNASRNQRLKFISPDPATLEEFRGAISNGEYYIYQEVPAETIEAAYEGRVTADGPTRFWTFPYQIMVRGEIDDDTVYAITKAFWENIDEIREQSAALSLISLDTAFESISGEIHPGAQRYYEEIGRM